MAQDGTTLLEASAAYLGKVLEPEQAQRVVASLALFFSLQALGKKVLPSVIPADRWDKLTDLEKTKISGWCVSIFHAVTGVSAATYIMATQEGTVVSDRIYGTSLNSCRLFNYTMAYFLWDLIMVFKAPTVDLGFLAHHVVGFATLVTMLHPFMQFYGLCCTLFELSTPFLSYRSIMLALGYKGSPAVKRAELLFGLAFLVGRILFGVPMAVYGTYEGTVALWKGLIQYKSHYAILFATNTIMIVLNILWFGKILRMSKKKPDNKKSD
ncbi:Transmembrane protein 56-like C [Hondaea fermentalgiana]|uniref:Transmembrane protein 56-like C n=1 Tax=Hondaea fermentalgiana TaxID=2315210 RepID=A0A2R5G5W6_9STRA|nr:Transmembrane protein 56-like C [Hondaea fermentalgiana]|eukprot:GBG25729.1 Transmembrane protein 56-like C [Hondaea fermentalgiana]